MSQSVESGRSPQFHARNNERNAALSANRPPAEAALELLKEYARAYPEVAALWVFGLGFVLGWKLRPW